MPVMTYGTLGDFKMKAIVSVAEWEERRKAYYVRMRYKFHKYLLYCKWYGSDYSDIEVLIHNQDGISVRGDVSSVNMTALIGRSFQAHLFFNKPQVIVKQISGFRSEEIASLLTLLDNAIADDTDLYWEGRMLLLDAYLAPFMVAKVGYSVDIVVDEERIEKDRQKATTENNILMNNGIVNAKPSDIKQVHLDKHEELLEHIRIGEFGDISEDIIENIKEHIESHNKDKVAIQSPTEALAVKEERVFIRRKKPNLIWFDLNSRDVRHLTYVAETFIRTIDDMKADKRFVTNSKTMPDKNHIDSSLLEMIEDDHWYLNRDGVDRVVIHEVVDLLNNQVITFASGAEQPMRVVPYDMKDIRPNGPYEIVSIDEDPKSIVGISQPTFFEDQQRDVNTIHTVKVAIAKMSVPGIVHNEDHITSKEASIMGKPIIGRQVSAKNLQEKRIQDVYSVIPTPNINPEHFAVEAESMGIMERASLLGAPKLGGGDRARTATASALLQESSSALTQRSAVLVDKFFLKLITAAQSIAMKYYDVGTVARFTGPKAYDIWPAGGFTDGEIRNHQGVEIIVGTMRRQSTDIELKLMNELLGLLTNNPVLVNQPAGMSVIMKLMDHIFKLYGAPIDLAEEIRLAAEQQPAPISPGGGQQEEKDGTPDLASMLQGMQNVGGGRTGRGQ